MNNEIKEILDDLDYAKNKQRGTITLNQKDIDLLLDYITNLQKENERLNKDNKILKQNNINEVLRNDFDMCVKDLKKANKKIEKLEDYKSRIEKSVEYIKSHQKVFALGVNEKVDEFDYISTSPKALLNILNGRSDE